MDNNKDPKNNDKKPKSRIWITLVFSLAIILIGAWIFNAVSASHYIEKDFSHFLEVKNGGNLKEVERAFSVEVQEMVWDEPVMDDPAMMEEPVETGMPLWGWILIGTGGGAAVVTVLAVIRKAKKRKAARALEEEDDYDD